MIYPSMDETLNLYSTAGAIILRISHGYEVKENNDPFIDLADRAMDQFSRSTAPTFVVNIVPFCTNLNFAGNWSDYFQ